jgi:DNA-binding CsgD family transcriptional regulator
MVRSGQPVRPRRGPARGKTPSVAPACLPEGFAETILDAMSAHIAILDRNGVILKTNRAWREFSKANGVRTDPATMRVNYLNVCDVTEGEFSREAQQVADGIRAVLGGERDEVVLDYPCHCPGERRWFYMRVTRIPGRGAMRAVVSHENITPLKLAEEALQANQEALQKKTGDLKETNTALKVLLRQREDDRGDLEQSVLRNVRERVLPYVEKLKTAGLRSKEKNLLEVIERQLNEIVSPLLSRLSTANLILTPQEIQVALLVREGRSSKQIAELLGVAVVTVNFHRKNLRKKLGIGNSPVNLRAYMLSLK